MSKKDRLKAQKEKQDIIQKEIEEQERLEAEEARHKQSKSAKKMMKKAKRARHGREPIICLILKILMLVPYGYSGFFYGGVLVTGVFGGYIEPAPPKWVGWCALIGSVLVLAGIIVSFFKKYIASFIVICGGTGVFLKGAEYMINKIQNHLENYAVDEAYENMDKQYMIYYYPIMAVAAVAFILLVISVVRKILKNRRAKYQRDTAPVASIVPNDE
jgi:glucan phosphoethanolaminetransferase (alkaline phosphatase superfamily)